MIPPPPQSTLFPYTTLFRSVAGMSAPVTTAKTPGYASARVVSIEMMRAWGCEDRKSTRLNSSHVRISYAVFCLKKKKERIIDNAVSRDECRTKVVAWVGAVN